MNSTYHKRVVKALEDRLDVAEALAGVSAKGINKGLEGTIDELRLQKKILVERVASLEAELAESRGETGA